MASKYKRTTTKIGKYGRRTVTYNANGHKTISNSSRSPNSISRRTISTRTGRSGVRVTYTTKLGGGWIRRKTSTLNGARSMRKNHSKYMRPVPGQDIVIGALMLIGVLVYLIVNYYAWFLVCAVWCLDVYVAYRVFNNYYERLAKEHNSRVLWEPYINE